MSGRILDLADPKPESICLFDIAIGLARTSRWRGQTKTTEPLSVAQHCVRGTEAILNQVWKNFNQTIGPFDFDAKFAAAHFMLHDAAEAYIGDIPTPLKNVCPDLRAVEHNIHNAIITKLGLKEGYDQKLIDFLTLVDKAMFNHEWLVFMENNQFGDSYEGPTPLKPNDSGLIPPKAVYKDIPLNIHIPKFTTWDSNHAFVRYMFMANHLGLA